MRAKDFRAIALKKLRGNWGAAVAAGLVASLLLGVPSVITNLSSSSLLELVEQMDVEQVLVGLGRLAMLSWLASVVGFILSGIVLFGICDFFTRLVKGEPVTVKQVFGQFSRVWDGICMRFMVNLFTVLWMFTGLIPGCILVALLVIAGIEPVGVMILIVLLCTVPAVLAIYRYAMVPYLMAEFRDLGVMDAIRESKRLMAGNKWRMFCLELSFIGWSLLCVLSIGIGFLWLRPYMYAAQAAFYMEITGRGEPEEPEQPAQPEFLNKGPEL